MDQLYKNVKTGEQKRLPIKVYEANRKNWKPIEEPKTEPVKDPEPIKLTDPGEKANLEILEQVTKEPLTEEIQESEDTPTEDETSIEELQAEYEKLSGEKPDGRWGVKKLTKVIEELKDKQ